MRGSGKSRPGSGPGSLVAFLLAAALLSLAVAAPVSADPANEEYNLDIPEAGSGGSGDDGTTDPAASTGTDDDTTVPADSGESADTDDSSGAAGGSSDEGTGSGGSGTSGDSDVEGAGGHGVSNGGSDRAHTIPQIAADGAGNSGVWLLLLGLAAVLAVAVFLIYKRRRPRQLEA
jgi:LPXTG-motif cell wall-anchored protein